MGQGMSCRQGHESGIIRAVRNGGLEAVKAVADSDPTVLDNISGYSRLSPLHVAAANGQTEVLCMLLDRSVNPDTLNRHKQTPLMLASMNGKISCVQKLIEAGANILLFDLINARTCLHYAAYHGHSDCVLAILSAARSTKVSNSWGFSRFVNIRDGGGATPLHLAARQKRAECVRTLLDNGALVWASTARYGYPGSTPLHLAARSGSLECVRALLSWGADRLAKDVGGRKPYTVAFRHKHWECAALLNPLSAEPLIWPSPLTFIKELAPEAKALLQRALLEGNMEREKKILRYPSYDSSRSQTMDLEIDGNGEEESNGCDDVELLCGICFDQGCSIEMHPCGHQMCGRCLLALCCQKKPNRTSACFTAPVCPFCRSEIGRLLAVKIDMSSSSKPQLEVKKSMKPNSSPMSPFGRIGCRRPGKCAVEIDEEMDKP